MHALAALGIVVASIDPRWACLALMGLAAHGRWRFPSQVPELLRGPAGDWAIPSLGRAGLRLAPESREGGWWIRLALQDAGGSVSWLLLEDQLEPAVWRGLRTEVRGRIK